MPITWCGTQYDLFIWREFDMIGLFSLVRTCWLLITPVMLLAITVLSLWPADMLYEVGGSDKVHHFIAYSALMFPVALRRPPYWWGVGLLFVLWSGSIELIQPYVNRYGEWPDLVANVAGLACGSLLAFWLSRKYPAVSGSRSAEQE